MASIEPVRYRRSIRKSADGTSHTVKVELSRRDWRWRVRYRDTNGRSRERSFDRKYDAERFLETNGADLTRSEWIEPQLRRASSTSGLRSGGQPP